MTRALFLENPHGTADEVFVKNGVGVARNPGVLDEAELIHVPQGVDYPDLCSKMSVTREVFETSPQSKAIGAFCIGTNQIDLETATESGIYVFNAPYSNTRPMVELAIGEITDLYRRVTVKSPHLHRGIWDKSADGVHEVRGRTLDIIGYDNIGTRLSVLAGTTSLNVIFYDVAERPTLGNVTQMPTMESVLRKTDIASVHVDGQLVNVNLLGARELAMMKPGALFINLSRGFIVSIDTLHDALVLGHLIGAVVDVLPEEPNKNGDLFTSPLARPDNATLTPHIGGSTEETQYDIGRFVTSKIVDYENTDSTDMFVNLPNLQLSASEESCYRVVLTCRNIPGILATVSNIFARTGANIGAQILGTVGQTGYVLMDINSELPVEVIEKTRSMKDTTRLITTCL